MKQKEAQKLRDRLVYHERETNEEEESHKGAEAESLHCATPDFRGTLYGMPEDIHLGTRTTGMMRSSALLLLAAAGNNQFTPSFPGGIVGWIVCNARKRQEYGGWLLFFYWQLYSGVILTTVFFCVNFQSYVPENFTRHPERYYWFVASAVPSLVIFALEVAVATILISVRTWDLLRLLRGLILAQVVAAFVSLTIDAKFFPENVPLSLTLMMIPYSCWLAYFYLSKRVKHVFQTHDWDTAVETIYPGSTPTRLGI